MCFELQSGIFFALKVSRLASVWLGDVQASNPEPLMSITDVHDKLASRNQYTNVLSGM
jgi:hypothetical protein